MFEWEWWFLFESSKDWLRLVKLVFCQSLKFTNHKVPKTGLWLQSLVVLGIFQSQPVWSGLGLGFLMVLRPNFQVLWPMFKLSRHSEKEDSLTWGWVIKQEAWKTNEINELVESSEHAVSLQKLGNWPQAYFYSMTLLFAVSLQSCIIWS